MGPISLAVEVKNPSHEDPFNDPPLWFVGLKNAGYEDAYHSQSASPASYGSSSVSVNKLEFGYNDATMKPPPAPLCIMPREFHTPPPERPPSATSKWSESSGPPGYQRKHSASATLPMLG